MNAEPKQFKIKIECELSPGWGGERWDVKRYYDKSDGSEIGDIGIYEFDAHSNFSSDLLEATIRTLIGHDLIKNTSDSYLVEVEIVSPDGELGRAWYEDSGTQIIRPRNSGT